MMTEESLNSFPRHKYILMLFNELNFLDNLRLEYKSKNLSDYEIGNKIESLQTRIDRQLDLLESELERASAPEVV